MPLPPPAPEPPPIDVDAFNAFEATGWERKAATYDRFFGRLTGRLVEPLLAAARVTEGVRVLDVATGPGYAAGRAAELGASVVGVDVASAMIELARQGNPGVEFRTANAEALPFEDKTFDAVVGNFMILHVASPEQGVREFARVLVPGGRLALTVWDLPERNRLIGVLLDAIAATGASPPTDIPAGPPFYRFSVDEEFASLLAGAGLDGVAVDTVTFDYPIPSAEHLWDGLLSGTVRTSSLILRQPVETRERIRTALDESIGKYQREEGLELPVSVKLAHGTKA